MSEDLTVGTKEETQMIVHSLNRLNSKGYDDRWIANYLSEKTLQNIRPENIRKDDFTLRNGDSIGWRSFEWMVVK